MTSGERAAIRTDGGRDVSRSAVYAAEDQVAAVLDRGGVIDFFGSTLDLPQQRRFGDLAGVVAYLRAVRRCAWGHGDVVEPRVAATRGTHRATWTAPDSIALPASTRWAMTELVVLHEYSHHVTWHRWATADHGPQFRAVMRQLVGDAMSPAAALVLHAAYDGAGARP